MRQYDTSELYKDIDESAQRLSRKVILGVAFISGIIGSALLHSCEESPTNTVTVSHLTGSEKSLASWFAGKGSPKPLEMAIAVSKTKDPALFAALAIAESTGNPSATGDGGRSKGAFQVQEKHWGPVPETATEQALQAEKILEDLLQDSSLRDDRRGSLRYALARYNGGGRPPGISYRRADRVINIAKGLRERRRVWAR